MGNEFSNKNEMVVDSKAKHLQTASDTHEKLYFLVLCLFAFIKCLGPC